MGAAVKHRFEFKGIYPFRRMAFIADSYGGLFNVFRITGIDMKAAGPVAHLAPGIFERRGCLHSCKTAGLSVGSSVTFQTTLVFGLCQTFFHDLNVLKGTGFGSIRDKAAVLPLMTRLAAFTSDIGINGIAQSRARIHAHETADCGQQPKNNFQVPFFLGFHRVLSATPGGVNVVADSDISVAAFIRLPSKPLSACSCRNLNEINTAHPR
jgi:hypothetical protein